jgi:uncharacterized protein (DUF2249 family)
VSEFAETSSLQRLDLRGLDPPEPMRRALEAVEALSSGEVLRIITDREPLLLYRELDRRGHAHATQSDPDGFQTTIRRGAEGGVT